MASLACRLQLATAVSNRSTSQLAPENISVYAEQQLTRKFWRAWRFGWSKCPPPAQALLSFETQDQDYPLSLSYRLQSKSPCPRKVEIQLQSVDFVFLGLRHPSTLFQDPKTQIFKASVRPPTRIPTWPTCNAPKPHLLLSAQTPARGVRL